MFINNVFYTELGKLIDNEHKFIGGVLEDWGDKLLRNQQPVRTKIIEMTLVPDIKGAYFEVRGKSFKCGFNTYHGKLDKINDGWLEFSEVLDHRFRIQPSQGDSLKKILSF